ncbi:MAG: 1-acyl-sn-glycerol-3-phosphate acyltransferase [Acidobacteriota bacterium]
MSTVAAVRDDSPRRLLLAHAGDALGDALAEALARPPDGAAPTYEVECLDAAEPAGGAALLVLPDRTTPRRLAEGLSDSDRVLLDQLRYWSRNNTSRRLFLVSSALVHQPSHRQPGHLAENALPRRPPSRPVARRWRRIEEALVEAAGSQAEVTVLRPTPIPLRKGEDLFSRLLGGSFSAVPAGFDPPLQLLSLEDLIAAIRAALAGEWPTGTWHLAPNGVIPLRKALRQAGVRPLPLPAFVLRAVCRLRGEAPDAVEALRYPFTVSDAARRGAMAGSAPPATLDRPVHELEYDPFSLDRAYIDRLGRTLFRFLHNRWWRIEWRGLEHIPRQGAAVLVGNHRGHQPWDGVMILHRLARDLGRYPRFLIHPALVKFPHLAPYMSRCGGVHACRENGDWALSQKELLAVFPEGIRGAFRSYRKAHKLARFRPDYVRFALRHRVPIIPITIVGSAEIFPILGKLDWTWWKRLSEWPTLPVTPTLSLLPLPSKWHIEVLEPIDLASEYGPEAADDPGTYRAINTRVRQRMADHLQSLYRRRPGIFRGKIFPNEPSPVLGDPT